MTPGQAVPKHPKCSEVVVSPESLQKPKEFVHLLFLGRLKVSAASPDHGGTSGSCHDNTSNSSNMSSRADEDGLLHSLCMQLLKGVEKGSCMGIIAKIATPFISCPICLSRPKPSAGSRRDKPRARGCWSLFQHRVNLLASMAPIQPSQGMRGSRTKIAGTAQSSGRHHWCWKTPSDSDEGGKGLMHFSWACRVVSKQYQSMILVPKGCD